MAQKDPIDSFIDVSAIQKQVDAAINSTNKLFESVKKGFDTINSLQINIGNNSSASGFSELKKQSEEVTKSMGNDAKAYTSLWKSLLAERESAEKAANSERIAIQKQAAAEERELNKMIAAEEKVLLAQSKAERRAAMAERKQIDREYQNTWKSLLKERDDLERQSAMARKREAAEAVNRVAIDSNVAMSKTLNDLRGGFDRLTKAERENENIGGVLIARIKELDTQLKGTDAATGRFARNVGNYAGAISPLQRQIGLIAGELPNIQYGFRTMFSSLSNQIGGFTDAIKQTIAVNKALKAEGQATVSVFRQIVSAFGGWQVALLALAGILPVIIERLGKESEATKRAREANERYTKSLQDAEDQAVRSTAGETSRIQTLTAIAADNTAKMNQRIAAVQELQRTYPETFGNLTQQAILEGKLGEAIKETTIQIIAKNKAIALSGQLQENELRVRNLEEKNLEDQKRISRAEIELINARKNADKGSLEARDAAITGYAERLYQARSDAKETAKELKGAYDESNKLAQGIESATKRAGMLSLKGDKEKKSPIKKAKEINQNTSSDIVRSAMDQLGVIETAVAETRDEALRNLLDNLKSGEISVIEYESTKAEIVKNSEDEILQEQLKYLKYRLDAIGLNAENAQKVTEKYTDLYIQEIKKRFDAEEDEAKRAAKNLAGFQEAMYKNKSDFDKLELKAEKSKGEYKKKIAQEVAQFTLQLLNSQIENQIKGFEDQKEIIDKEKDARIEAVDSAALNEEEKLERKKVIEAESAEQQKQIDNEIDKRRKEQAILAKAAALATILINTATASIAALAPPPVGLGPVIGGTLLPFIIGLGAAQAAVVAATPAYAEGKDAADSYTGRMLWGEAGAEAKIDRHGRLSMATKPTFGYTESGDTILSNKDLRHGALADYFPAAAEVDVPAMLNGMASIQSDNTKKIVKAIKGIRPGESVSERVLMAKMAAKK